MDQYQPPRDMISEKKFLPPIFKKFIDLNKEGWISDFKRDLVKYHLADDHKQFSQTIMDYQQIFETSKIDQDLRNFILEILLTRLFRPKVLVHAEIYNLLTFTKNFLDVKKSKIQVSLPWQLITNFIWTLWFDTNTLYYQANFYGRENCLTILGSIVHKLKVHFPSGST